MRNFILASLLLSTGLAFAQNQGNERLTMETFEVAVPTFKLVGNDVVGAGGGAVSTETAPPVDPFVQTGKVISSVKDMVALGESVYDLVKKGRPTVTTDYAPISVVPRDPISKEIIEPFDLEGFSMPVQKKFVTVLKAGTKDVVRFEYMVMYSYGGSYNGAGKFITGAQIIPVNVKVGFGWDFNASMKVSGILNHGTKADPVAGVMLIIKYQMNSWSSSEERNDTFHITGNGELKSYAK